MMEILLQIGMGYEVPSLIDALLNVETYPKKPKFFLHSVMIWLLISLSYCMIVCMRVWNLPAFQMKKSAFMIIFSYYLQLEYFV